MGAPLESARRATGSTLLCCPGPLLTRTLASSWSTVWLSACPPSESSLSMCKGVIQAPTPISVTAPSCRPRAFLPSCFYSFLTYMYTLPSREDGTKVSGRSEHLTP
jgi:hypothetical protein